MIKSTNRNPAKPGGTSKPPKWKTSYNASATDATEYIKTPGQDLPGTCPPYRSRRISNGLCLPLHSTCAQIGETGHSISNCPTRLISWGGAGALVQLQAIDRQGREKWRFYSTQARRLLARILHAISHGFGSRISLRSHFFRTLQEQHRSRKSANSEAKQSTASDSRKLAIQHDLRIGEGIQ